MFRRNLFIIYAVILSISFMACENVSGGSTSVDVTEILLDGMIYLADPSHVNGASGGASTMFKMEAQIFPKDATNKNIKWDTFDENVATVSQDGVVRAKNIGSTTITATIDKVVAKSTINVMKEITPIESVKINQADVSVDVNKTLQLSLSVMPNGAEISQTVIWRSSDNSIARVNYLGLLQGISTGTATISVSAGGKKDEITVSVIEPPFEGTFEQIIDYITNDNNISKNIKVKFGDYVSSVSAIKDALKERELHNKPGKGLVEIDLANSTLSGLYGNLQLGHEAFAGCNVLKSIRLPSGLSKISQQAFANCAYLDTVEFNYKPASKADMDYFLGSIFQNCHSLKTIIVPTGCKEYYVYALGEYSNVENIIVEK